MPAFVGVAKIQALGPTQRKSFWGVVHIVTVEVPGKGEHRCTGAMMIVGNMLSFQGADDKFPLRD